MDQVNGLQRVTTDEVPLNRLADTPTSGQADSRSTTKPADYEIVADQAGIWLEKEVPQVPSRPSWWTRNRKWAIGGAIVTVLLIVGINFGMPYVREALNTVSTDDAFVAGHITNVSPRVSGVVTEVLVDQNDRVEPGMPLLRLDREPFALEVARARAARDQAEAELVQSRTEVQAEIAQARASYYRRKSAQEQLRRQVASLRARVATREARQSELALAQVDQRRLENLVRRGSATRAELDERNNTLKVARERVKEANAAIQETRAVLGLPPNEADPLDVPDDLEVQQSTVEAAVSDIVASLARVGIQIDPGDPAESKSFQEFLRPEGGKAVGEGLEAVVNEAPAVRVARAARERAERELDDARLRLSYTEVRSEVAGHVQERSVHPGNQVSPGQTLLSIRPDDVWIEANYKETQIHYFRIGHPVDLEVDAYPDRVFHGRVAGFSPGTGLSEALLPPENATGNYVKVTQRLPVRIELTEEVPAETPLFIGLSVVPRVRFKEEATGPGAGRRLHSPSMTGAPDIGRGPASRRPRNGFEAAEARP